MKFENLEVFNFEGALRGMRNPMNSWDKSDSKYCNFTNKDCASGCPLSPCLKAPGYILGPNDLALAQRLIRAGSEHRKFLRQIFISLDITAPLYYWKEADTYKVGTVANSTSTMHKLATTPITLDCFETDDYNGDLRFEQEAGHSHVEIMSSYIIDRLESLRKNYLKTKDKAYWKELIRWLPESWLQTRTITMNYENVYNIIRQRANHKLTEWNQTNIYFLNNLPYAKELLFLDLL